MATYTETYNLVKPDETDGYDVTVFNENWDTLDTELTTTAAQTESISDKIGSPNDTGTNTVFGKLNAGSSFIKSIQSTDIGIKANGGNVNLSLQTVNPSRCLVIMQRLKDDTHLNTKVIYTLSETNINVTTTCSTSGDLYLRFQIIEFN